MQRITYRITTLSPVLIPVRIGEVNTVHTQEFINGSALLGAFAHRYIHIKKLKKGAYRDQVFHTWFLTDNLKFTNAYIVNQETGRVHFPPPLSVQKEKNEEPIDGDAFIDLLFKDPEELQEADVQAKPLEGFVWLEDDTIDTCSVKTSLNFHHQRNKKTGTTEEGLIFNYESIDPGQIFEGHILGESSTLSAFLEVFGQIDPIYYLGRSKNAQYGKVKIEFVSTKPELFFSEVDQLNTEKREFEDGNISLILLSDTIFYNKQGFPTTDLATLEKYLSLTIDEEKSVIKTGDVENFISVWGLRRPAEICFKAGSSLLIKASATNKDRLLTLQREGIGERCNEGFGRIVFGWNPGDEGLNKSLKSREEQRKSPQFPIPGIAKKIVETTIKEFITKQVKLAALNQVRQFKNHTLPKQMPTRSLLGRLEAMVQKSNREQFRKHLDKLRKTARDKLGQCRDHSKTLFDFLRNYDVDIGIIFNKHDKLKNLADITGFSIEKDAEFLAQLYQLYLTTLFAMMRKQINRKGGA